MPKENCKVIIDKQKLKKLLSNEIRYISIKHKVQFALFTYINTVKIRQFHILWRPVIKRYSRHRIPVSTQHTKEILFKYEKGKTFPNPFQILYQEQT